MNTFISFALSAAALLPAAPPAAPVPVTQAEGLPLTGKVLVLRNERTVEGEIEYVAGRYRVRRPVGETWIEAAGVLRLCPGLPEAYACLRAQELLKPADVDKRLRLAEWCVDHGMATEALAETEEALRLNKTHPEGRRLLARLQIVQGSAPAHPVTPPPLPVPPPTPDLELTSEALNLFGTRVQPILMNTCATATTTRRTLPSACCRPAKSASATARRCGGTSRPCWPTSTPRSRWPARSSPRRRACIGGRRRQTVRSWPRATRRSRPSRTGTPRPTVRWKTGYASP